MTTYGLRDIENTSNAVRKFGCREDIVKTVHIVVIGHELLLGQFPDTNSHFLCKEITARGGRVTRVTVVGDELDDIITEVRTAFDRDTDLVITTGGLGPTEDDLTHQAVSAAIGRPTAPNIDGLRMLKAKLAKLALDGSIDNENLTASRKKMAVLPEGAEALANPYGTAPGSYVQAARGAVLSFPGVPAELEAMVHGEAGRVLTVVLGHRVHRVVSVHTDSRDESRLSPILAGVSEEFPDVYVKSIAVDYGPNVQLEVRLSATGDAAEGVEQRVTIALASLDTRLRTQGIRIVRTTRMGGWR